MVKKLLFMVCSLAAVVTMAIAPEPDRGKELSQKIEPALKSIEELLDEIEADFWKNIWEIDRLHNLFESDSLYQTFNGKLVKLVSNCGVLQADLYKSGVKMQYPMKESAVRIQAIWKDLSQLHQRMMKRKDPVTKAEVRLDPECIFSIYLTSEIPKNICNYEALLDDLAIVNLELFYIDGYGVEAAIPRNRNGLSWMIKGKYYKLFNEDRLISSAGEFFMAVRDLRLTIRGLRRDPFPKPVQNDDPYDLICRIEVDLNQIEREFWDHIYKGGSDPGKSNNITRYGEFGDHLQNMRANSRIFLNLLRSKKIAYETFNPVPDALTIYNLGKTLDSELRHQMRRFFNGEKKQKIFLSIISELVTRMQ